MSLTLFFSYFLLLNRATGFEGTKFLSVEVPCGKQEDSKPVEVMNVNLYDSTLRNPPPQLTYPSEITEMHLELGRMEIHKGNAKLFFYSN